MKFIFSFLLTFIGFSDKIYIIKYGGRFRRIVL